MFKKRKKITTPNVKFQDFWEIDDKQTSSAYQKLMERIEHYVPLELPTQIFNRWKYLAIAASVALLVVGGLYLQTLTSNINQPVEIVCITEDGSQITLSDGTKVWLSANSQLRYNQTFTGKTRDVTLEGEAYFEVAHNSKQQFRVLAGGQTVVALGTSFNVRAYSNETDVKVTLVEGIVSVTDQNTGQAVVLKPAQEAFIVKSSEFITVSEQNQPLNDNFSSEQKIPKNGFPITVNDIEIDNVMSWKTGRYVFYNMTFEEIAKMLEKGFKVNINIENEELKSKPYTMRFENDESLEKILDLIQINAKYSYQYYNGNIIIK